MSFLLERQLLSLKKALVYTISLINFEKNFLGSDPRSLLLRVGGGGDSIPTRSPDGLPPKFYSGYATE